MITKPHIYKHKLSIEMHGFSIAALVNLAEGTKDIILHFVQAE